jgi:L-threonylcarbamoyladenylate synthase
MKNRPQHKGMILIAADLAQVEQLVVFPKSHLGSEILSSWPGPVTWVLSARLATPAWITGGRNTIAVRVTDHPIARNLCQRAESPLISTSANRGNCPPLKRVIQVRAAFGSELDYIVPGAPGPLTNPTIIRDGKTGDILRA